MTENKPLTAEANTDLVDRFYRAVQGGDALEKWNTANEINRRLSTLDAAHAAREAAEVLVTAYKHATATASDRAAILAAECESLRAVVDDAVRWLECGAEAMAKTARRGDQRFGEALAEVVAARAAEAARLAGKPLPAAGGAESPAASKEGGR